MRTLLTAIIVMSFRITSTFAEEITVRCDPTSAPNALNKPFVLSIDMDKKIVHLGNDPDKGWFYDGRTVQVKEIMAESTCDVPISFCIYNITNFVQISNTKIKFGNTSSSNINSCGCSSQPFGIIAPGFMDHMPGQHFSYTIYRDTGTLEEFKSRLQYYQCQKFTGNAID
jgi:hypothetical protein